jgi:hypothetical protein
VQVWSDWLPHVIMHWLVDVFVAVDTDICSGGSSSLYLVLLLSV